MLVIARLYNIKKKTKTIIALEGMPEIYLSNCTADEWEIIILFIIQMNEETVDGVQGFLDACLSFQLFRKRGN